MQAEFNVSMNMLGWVAGDWHTEGNLSSLKVWTAIKTEKAQSAIITPSLV